MNSNRLTALETSTSETDLEAAFDAANFTQSTAQTLNIEAESNRLLGFSQTMTRTQGGGTVSSVVSQVNYSVDANGAMTSDGLRTFEYDESRRLSQVKIVKDGEAATVRYLHNALGQRVFKSTPEAEQTLPSEKDLGPGFVNWLKQQFGWLFAKGNGAKSSVGTAYVYDQESNLLGEYDTGSAQGMGNTEYIWLPIEGGQAIPIGMYRNGKLYAIHADHLGTPRLMTDSANQPVWQWPYSAFGNNKPTGPLNVITTGTQTRLKATAPAVEVNLRFPGQYYDVESNLHYNNFRTYDPRVRAGYTQFDPIGLAGGWNGFIYVNGNPLSFTDALGLQSDARPNRRGWPAWAQPVQPNRDCATAECAAGLLPTPSDNRSQKEVDFGQCKMVCQIALLAPVAACNAIAGGGLAGTAGAAVAKGGVCTWVCK